MRTILPKRQDIGNLLRHAESLELSADARKRLAWFAYALAHDGNVSLTCRYFGISRTTFLRWAARFDARDPKTLEERSRRPHRVRRPEVPLPVVHLIAQYRRDFPTMGKELLAFRLRRDHGLTVSASTVGRVIAREKLFFADRPSHAEKLQASPYTDSTLSAPSARASSSSASEEGEAGAFEMSDFPVFGS